MDRKASFLNGVPTEVFKRNSSLFKMAVKANGAVIYKPASDLTENALQQMRIKSDQSMQNRRRYVSAVAARKK